MLKKKKNAHHASEPEPVYSTPLLQQTDGKKIVISTLEQQEEANYTYWLSLSPEQRLALHYKMITTIYKDELNKKRKDKTIKFTL